MEVEITASSGKESNEKKSTSDNVNPGRLSDVAM
jgi:hypothetical protein